MIGVLAVAALSAVASPVQEGVPEPVIVEIVVEGNEHLTADRIVAGLATHAGSPLDRGRLREDLAFLWSRLRVQVLDVEIEPVEGGLRLVLRVRESPMAGSIRILGAEAFSENELMKAAGLTQGTPVDEAAAERAARAVESHYRDNGHAFAHVVSRFDAAAGTAVLDIADEGPVVMVGRILVEGATDVPFDAPFWSGLQDWVSVMQVEAEGRFLDGSKFQRRVLDEDIVRIEALYHQLGFLDARVGLADLVFTQDREQVDVVIRVDQGPLFRVARIEVEGVEAVDPEEVLARISLQAGDVYEQGAVGRDMVALRAFYEQLGFPFHPGELPDGWAFLDPSVRQEGEEPEVVVTYRLREGRRMAIRDVLIRGNRATRDRVIRRELLFEPGEPLRVSLIETSVRRLASTNFFQGPGGMPDVGYRILPTQDPQLKDVLVEVGESTTGAINFGGGFSSTTGVVGQLRLVKQNFDLFDPPSSWGSAMTEILDGRAFTGGGQDLRATIQPGTIFSSYSLSFTEPDLFGDHVERISLGVTVSDRFRFLRTHDEDRKGGSVSLGRQFSRESSLRVSLGTQEITVEDVVLGAEDLFTPDFPADGSSRTDRRNTLSLTGSFNGLDVPMDPRSGHRARLSGDLTGSLLGADVDLYRATLDTLKIVPLYTDGRGRVHTLNLSLRGGVVRPYGDTDVVPFIDKFFLGGTSTFSGLRGFDFRGVGPINAGGFAVGGDAMWATTVSYGFPLFSTPVPGRLAEHEHMRGVVFLDAGALGPGGVGVSPINGLGDVRASVGFGIRFALPMPGMALPLSFDFALPLRDEAGDDTQTFSFTLASPF